jgi:2',3'-cyclic-nucleotide 2'-phosphodiesterase (5'-nucleotidase family)
MLRDTIEAPAVGQFVSAHWAVIFASPSFNQESHMKKSAQKILAGLSVPLLMLVLLQANAPPARAQQPAPKVTGSPTQSPAKQPGADVRARVTETAVDASIPNDPPLDKMLAVYSPKVRELDVMIGKLKGELKKGGAGSGSLGNFVTDGMRFQASLKTGKPVALALMNGGGMRRNAIGEGDLRARDIFELLPFENALVTLDLTGEQLMKVMRTVVAGREAQSGARLVYKTNADKKSELVSAKLREATGEKEIDPNGIYTIVTIDYLYRVGGNTYGVLREGKNMKELGITLRDAIMNYVKSETAAGRDIRPNLDGRFVFDRAGSAVPEEVRPQ